jgi:hypothetical protein
MASSEGKNKLMSSRSAYQSAAGQVPAMPGVVPPGKGFELKSGSNGRSSGAALPIYQGPGDGPTMGKPQSEVGPSDDSAEDEAHIVEPDQGFTG